MSLQDLKTEEPFSYRSTKSGSVQISYQGRTVTTLNGREGLKFISKVEANGGANAQLIMAKATGHFKHGTERTAKPEKAS